MKKLTNTIPEGKGKWHLILLITFFFTLCYTNAQAFTLDVQGVGPDGSMTPVTSFRWLVEEDATHRVVPDDPNTNWATDFHKSYMPVVDKGDELTQPVIDPTKYYYVSVLPKEPGTYSIGGAPIAPGQDEVTVYLNQLPLPTAQITIFVFEDTQPINNAPDLPEERGLEGFTILLEDAGGRYGMSAGMQMLDAFSNPLGTVYQRDNAGNFLLDPDGMPIPEMDNKGIPVVEPLVTDANGMITIKNLAPGKYGVQAVPPGAVETPIGSGNFVSANWAQTSTIEGKKVIDAWVKANEPPFFAEFGPPGFHVFIGFVRPMNTVSLPGGGSTITGNVVNLHLSRPPNSAFHFGVEFPHTTPWVGLNDLSVGIGKGIYAARTADGRFVIPNVPPGNYQLVVWDDNMDLIFAFKGVTVPAGGGDLALGDIPVFQWFSRLENWVFGDDNNNGIWDDGEMGLPEQAVNLRWRDGTMYQSFPTDGEGFVPFDEVFPFFSWLVAEVDFARWGASGVTVVVDGGGAIDPNEPPVSPGQLNPQLQPDNNNEPYRVETGPVLTQGFQGFLGQTSVIQWGKKTYGPGPDGEFATEDDENGGISGIVYYATTRAEDDPAQAAAEPWEPGIPRVTVNLYDSTGTVLLNTTTTDSWDDSLPTNCPGDNQLPGVGPTDCFDGMRNWNQVRPGVFDGGYAFNDACADVDGLEGDCNSWHGYIPAGEYIVEVMPPTGYEIVRTQDKNVDFGDEYIPSMLEAAMEQLPYPQCVGTEYEVPQELALFPGVTHPYYDPDSPWYKGGDTVYLSDCNRKQVLLSGGENTAADFFLFTEVPVAGHIVGFILDDTANEFDPNSPQFGEKYAPPWLPIGIYDWTGRLIGQTYSDQYGRYNALVPSTYTTNLPAPSGMSPNMLTTCMNDPQADPLDRHNSQYSTFCYTFQYMPGATTYLDTPVIPVAAFAGPDQFPLDCEFPDGTPRIKEVAGGPYVAAVGDTIMIQSMGSVDVPDPASDVPGATITRNYGFGSAKGTVSINGVLIPDVDVTSWSDASIQVKVPSTGQLVVTKADGTSSITGVTVTVGLKAGQNVLTVTAPSSAGVYPGAIQTAIDNAKDGDLILVAPGTYDEMVIMWKTVQLQGWGPGSVTISAVKGFQSEKLAAWRTKVEELISNNKVKLLPGQELGFGGIEPVTLFTEEGAGILVLAKKNAFKGKGLARIDGFTITGSDQGGGIVVNGYSDFLEISNNRIINNSGFFGGGIRIGHPEMTVDNLEYTDADNDFVRIHHNHITQNGGLGGAGGGVSMCTGSDSYEVSENYICGNFTLGNGGGIGHVGLSYRDNKDDPVPLIRENTIIFNESFNQGRTVSGGGMFIGGGAPLTAGGLSPGSGSVKVIGNLIQGNEAGAGDGGGIRASRVNGQDVADKNVSPADWYTVDIFNNMIVNNVAALAGGGISLQDTVRSNIIHNTVANNDSTATASEAFTADPNQSIPQPAGIVSRVHSPELNTTLGLEIKEGFSDPMLVDNIIWHNRSFYFFGDPNATPPVYELRPVVDPDGITGAVIDDLAVLGTATPEKLSPEYCILSSLSGAMGENYTGKNNLISDPAFLAEYFNANRNPVVTPPEPTTIQPVPAFDEGGNFIRLRFGPLTLGNSDYHISSGSPAVNLGGVTDRNAMPELNFDFDGQTRLNIDGTIDIGADEYYTAP